MSIDLKHLRTHAPVDSKVLLARLQKIAREKQDSTQSNGYKKPALVAGGSSDSAADNPHELRFFPKQSESGLVPPDFKPDESQIAALKTLHGVKRGCLIGAAGTGKTSIMRLLTQQLIYDEKVVESPRDIAYISFTGTASNVMRKALPPWLAANCQTIHGILEYAPAEEMDVDSNELSFKFMPRRTAQNKIRETLIFIDEASMVSTQLMQEIEAALKPEAIVIAIGDLNQIPPFAGSSAFGFMLAEQPVAELTTIHRQSDPKAQGIIDAAHCILKGKDPEMTQGSKEELLADNWSVWGFELDPNAVKAANQILQLVTKLSKMKTPEGHDLYNPHRDRIVTPGNGYLQETTSDMLQQYPLNIALAPWFDPPSESHPVYIIDAGASEKKFARGFRVMATKNEPPGTKERITNGMLGRIVEIKRNIGWSGDWGTVGPEDVVAANRKRAYDSLLGVKKTTKAEDELSDSEANAVLADLQNIDLDSPDEKMDELVAQVNAAKEGGRMAGPASHSLVIEFENGRTATFMTQSQVDSIQLAYATTVAKSQGAQHETIIMVVHHLHKGQLNRETLYTGITRATRRVIILYTPFGLTKALVKQRIGGNTLAEKIDRYKRFLGNARDES